ncbi:helix-hairpin-helix domain-containing protein [Aneurinibacillus terranovensis]|uniref:helix-hairpin-helix domain-containing protein n=1 Tax=Aneurinibacillus terranovensis TaxID=278991 RepID=UPI00041A1F8C|nr:helix-hairpin-helix domain-containing protein [Aneurinibacillus terranovensis]
MKALWMEKKRWIIVIIALCFLGCSVYYYQSSPDNNMVPVTGIQGSGSPREKDNGQNIHTTGGSAVSSSKKIIVDIKGAVAHPGVYTLKENDRLFQLIGMAGGFLPGADQKIVNGAMPLQDGTLIYIPAKGEKTGAEGEGPPVLTSKGDTSTPATPAAALPATASRPVEGSQQDEKVDINHATAEQLQTLPGIGPGKAAAILQYRQDHGAFKAEEDLRQIKGIGEKTLEKIRPKILVQ